MRVALPLAVVGIFWVVFGISLIYFSSDIQAYVLRYQPPEWWRPFWDYQREHVVRGAGYLLMLRGIGLGALVVGIVLLVSSIQS